MRLAAAATVAVYAVVLCAIFLSRPAPAAEDAAASGAPAAAPADRVVVMYFHRTQRCPTCKRMGSYAEEAVAGGFAEEIGNGKVEFRYVDFQDEKNAALTKGYKIGGPTLIVVKIADNKTKEYKNLTEIWEKNRDKETFLKYVRENVKAYLANP